MAKTLAQIREELAARAGFGAQPGSGDTLKGLLTPILQRSQEAIIKEFGDAIPGTIYPPNPFEADTDTPSVPEAYLVNRAMVEVKAHYNQPDSELAAQNWTNYERNLRGGSG